MNHRRLLLAAAGVAVAGTAGLALAGPANASPTTSGTAPSAAAAHCDAGPWAGRIQGAPAHFAPGAKGGDYLWHDAHGMHLRVTHRGHSRDVYTGTITSSSAMRIEPVKLEKGDVARLSANHRTLVFAFSNYGFIDGVNFHTDCASTITVAHLNEGNHVLPRTRVYLGATKAHPAHIPFTVHRKA